MLEAGSHAESARFAAIDYGICDDHPENVMTNHGASKIIPTQLTLLTRKRRRK